MSEMKMYQVSTLQALVLGYSRAVISVSELLSHGNIGLGTFTDVDGEMILLDGMCFRAMADGKAEPARPDRGVPFGCAANFTCDRELDISGIGNMDELKELLTLKIEEDFGLNSMYIVRIDGSFPKVFARSERGYRSQHVELKEMLSHTQRDFVFEDIRGTLVCVYFPDYMDGINAAGWHVHFLSRDRSRGGHVFDIQVSEAGAQLWRPTEAGILRPLGEVPCEVYTGLPGRGHPGGHAVDPERSLRRDGLGQLPLVRRAGADIPEGTPVPRAGAGRTCGKNRGVHLGPQQGAGSGAHRCLHG